MKKLVIYPVMFLMLTGIVMAASMSRSMPDRIQPGETLTVTFSVSGMETGKEVALSEILPTGWTISTWDVSGSEEAKADVTYKKKTGTEYQWSFTAANANPSITYTATVPSAVGTYDFDAVYMLPPANMDNLKKTLTVRVITCGDGVCEGGENSDNCEADCPKPAPPAEGPAVEEGAEEEGGGGVPIALIVIVVVAAIAIFLYMKKKKPQPQI